MTLNVFHIVGCDHGNQGLKTNYFMTIYEHSNVQYGLGEVTPHRDHSGRYCLLIYEATNIGDGRNLFSSNKNQQV